MSGIPIFTSSPINAIAKKPSAVTPQTAVPASQASDPSRASNPATATPSVTLTSTTSSSYPPPQPGTAAFPAPTSVASQRYAPVRPTPTTKTDTDGPPMPQPGAAPTPMSNVSPPSKNKSSESYPPTQQTSAPKAMPQPYPPQMSIPPPTAVFGQPHSFTSTANASSSSCPVSLPSQDDGRHSFEHPPGYHQNINASELTSEQRAFKASNNKSRDSYKRIGGEEGEGVWDTLGKMAQQAGAKISEAEAGIWRSINAEK